MRLAEVVAGIERKQGLSAGWVAAEMGVTVADLRDQILGNGHADSGDEGRRPARKRKRESAPAALAFLVIALKTV